MRNLERHTAVSVKVASIKLRVRWKRGNSARCLPFLDATSASRSRFCASVSASARSIFIVVDVGEKWIRERVGAYVVEELKSLGESRVQVKARIRQKQELEERFQRSKGRFWRSRGSMS
jgi:hypothetical protein